MTGLEAQMVVTRSSSFRLEVELSIDPGSTAALLGPNGSGKSTAVAALAGLLPIDEGIVVLGDRVLDDPSAGKFVAPDERRIGVVFQDYLLFPHLTVLENIAFGLRSHNEPRERALTAARSWMSEIGLDGLESSKPRDLSGGEAQRVALARALAPRPELLLLDEPLSALDVSTRIQLRRVLADHLERFPGPRLLITHDPTEAFLLADHVYVLEDGAVTQVGTADDIRLRPRTPYAADLAGSNLVSGEALDGEVMAGRHRLHIADHELSGPVLLTIHPTAIAIYRAKPDGSPRNSWLTAIERLEALGDRVRLRTGSPLPLTVEVTREATESLGLDEGAEVWVAVKATEIRVEGQAVSS